MPRVDRAVLGLIALVFLGAGCGSGSSSGGASIDGKPVEAGPNSRIKFKEDYKKMIGKNGQLLFKPSATTKRPPGIPK